jgi:hypothetical protein
MLDVCRRCAGGSTEHAADAFELNLGPLDAPTD